MDFFIYGGGNAKDPYNSSAINRVNDTSQGRYFVADARRFYVPQFHFDGSHSRWADWQAETAPAGIVAGDRIHTTLLLEGTELLHAVVHVKRASPGVKLKLVHTGAVGDTPAGTAGDVSVGVIDFSVPGYYKFPVAKMWQTDGTLLLVLKAGNIMDTCFTVSTAVVHHNDGHECGCYREPCVTEYPEPSCQ